MRPTEIIQKYVNHAKWDRQCVQPLWPSLSYDLHSTSASRHISKGCPAVTRLPERLSFSCRDFPTWILNANHRKRYIGRIPAPATTTHNISLPTLDKIAGRRPGTRPMEESPSQSPLTQPDSESPETGRRERMLHEFPRAHVTNLGGGTIGPVYLTRSQDGKVLFAEARLFHAPFTHMIIDSPALLDMFESPTQRVDLDALGHPWPQFRLEPREDMRFDVARLAREEYVRSGNKLEYTVKGSPYVSTMEVTASERVTRKRSQPAVSIEVQGTRHSERTSAKKKRVSSDTYQKQVSLPVTSPASPSPGASGVYTVATQLDETQAEAVITQMSVLKRKMFGMLSPDDQSTYEWVLTTGLKRQGKEGAKFRTIVADKLRELMLSQGERSTELQTLHNQYADLQRKLEKRWPYHLPHIDKLQD